MSASDWSELDGYEALVSELRANPPVAPERLRQRVLEGAPAPRRQRSRKRKLVLVVVPAAVVLAVGAALVHGFVSSGSHSNATSAQLGGARAEPAHAEAGQSGARTGADAKKMYPNLYRLAAATVTSQRRRPRRGRDTRRQAPTRSGA